MATSTRRTAKQAPAPADPTVRLRWLGDESRFTNGVPNRDVTTDDVHVDDELAAEAVASGTHEEI